MRSLVSSFPASSRLPRLLQSLRRPRVRRLPPARAFPLQSTHAQRDAGIRSERQQQSSSSSPACHPLSSGGGRLELRQLLATSEVSEPRPLPWAWPHSSSLASRSTETHDGALDTPTADPIRCVTDSTQWNWKTASHGRSTSAQCLCSEKYTAEVSLAHPAWDLLPVACSPCLAAAPFLLRRTLTFPPNANATRVAVGGNAVSAFLSWRLQATNACDVTLVWKAGYENVSQYGITFK